MKLSIETFEEKDTEDVSLAKYGTIDEMVNERLWTCGNKVPLKHMSEWVETVSLIARDDGKSSESSMETLYLLLTNRRLQLFE